MDGVKRPPARMAGALIAAGLLWRILAAWPAGDAARPYAVPQEEYFLSSVMLLASGVYTADPGGEPHAGRGPLYTTFLAMTQLGADRPSPRRARVAQAVLGALMALAAWGLGAKLRSPIAGALAAAFVALDPSLVYSTRGLDVHGFYGAMILLLGLAAANWAEREGDRRSGILLGLALGASLLCRSAHALAIPFLFAASFVWWGPKGFSRIGRPLIVAAAILVPWTLRNYANTGRLVPLDAGVGAYNLLAAADGGSRAVQYDEAFAIADRLEPGFSSLHRDEAEPKREAAVLRLALSTIAASPGAYLIGSLRRLAAFWLPMWAFLLAAGLAAISPRSSRGTKAAALVAASFVAYAAIGLGEGYRLGVEPLLAALAGIGAAGFFKPAAVKGPSPLRAGMPLAAAAAAALAVCLVLTPFDALASRRSWKPACLPPDGPLAAFLDDGVRLAGDGWYLANWPGKLRARPDVCAAMDAFETGDAREAVRCFEAAAALAPRDPEIRVSLAVALGAAGQRKRALAEVATAETLAAAPQTPRRVLESIRSTRAGLGSISQK